MVEYIQNDLLALTYYKSFMEFRLRLGDYTRNKHFNLNIANYLTRDMS